MALTSGIDNIISKPTEINNLHTPFMMLDFSLGGGVGESRWIELFAPEGIGKTTISLQIISFLLDIIPNTYALIMDVEQALNFQRIEEVFYQDNIDIDPETGKLYIDGKERGIFISPETFEQIDVIFDSFSKFCMENNLHGLLLWDSLVSAVSEKILKGSGERVGFKATAIQEIIEKYNSIFKKIPITQFVINQIRQKIEMNMFVSEKGSGDMVDSEYRIPGGEAHRFYTFQGLMLSKSTKFKYPTTTPRIEGRTVRIIPTKNKLGISKREVKLVFIPSIGYSSIISLLELMREQKIMTGSLSKIKFSYSEEKYGNLEKFLNTLLTNEKVFNEFFEMAFKVCLAYYKELKNIKRYKLDIMKTALKYDVEKTLSVFESNYDEIINMDLNSILNLDNNNKKSEEKHKNNKGLEKEK